jgi:hypothetical protein
MKKLLAGIVLSFVLVIGGRVTADPVTDGSRAALSNDYTLTEKINDIDVPYSVLLDAQMDYQGYAVMTVHRYRRGGQDVYRLHIKSGNDGTRENIYLLYDMDWKFIGDEKTLAPLQVKQPEPEEPTEQVEVSEPEEEDDQLEVEESGDTEEEHGGEEEPDEGGELPGTNEEEPRGRD